MGAAFRGNHPRKGKQMNVQEELTKLLMESYDRGVEDAMKAAMDSFQQALLLEREACAQIADAEASIEGIAQRVAAAIRARGNT